MLAMKEIADQNESPPPHHFNLGEGLTLDIFDQRNIVPEEGLPTPADFLAVLKSENSMPEYTLGLESVIHTYVMEALLVNATIKYGYGTPEEAEAIFKMPAYERSGDIGYNHEENKLCMTFSRVALRKRKK